MGEISFSEKLQNKHQAGYCNIYLNEIPFKKKKKTTSPHIL